MKIDKKKIKQWTTYIFIVSLLIGFLSYPTTITKGDVAAGGDGTCNLCFCTGTFMLTWLFKPSYNTDGALLMYCNCTAHPYMGVGYDPQLAYSSGGNYGDGSICGQWATLPALALPSALTLDKNGGSGGTNKIYLVYNNAYISKYSKKVIDDYERVTSYGDSITTITCPSQKGYTFAGYYSGNSKIIDKDGNITASTTKFKSDTTLTAKWTAHTYEIVYKPNGGTGTMQNSKHTYDDSKRLTANAFSKEGYRFTGWNTKKDGSGTAYANKESVENLTDADGDTITLYAQWEAQKYTLKVHPNGGSYKNTTEIYTFEDGLKYNADSKDNIGSSGKRTGYTLKGYYTKTSGGTLIYDANGVCVNDGTYWKNGKYIHANDLTVYAQWKINDYTVTYHANGGTTSASKGTYHYNDTVNLSPTASKNSDTFVGWATSPTATKPLTTLIMPDLATSSNKDYSSDWELTLYALYSIDVSDISNHTYPNYKQVNNDEVQLSIWKKGNKSNHKKYPLIYKNDAGIMYYHYELKNTDLSSFIGNDEYEYSLYVFDNAGNYRVLEGESPPSQFFWQTVNHWKTDTNSNQPILFDTTCFYVEKGQTFTPSYLNLMPTDYNGYEPASIDSGSYTVTGAKTSNAYYVPKVFTLSYNANGGSVSPNSKKIAYGEYYGELPTPTLEGHRPAGWYSSPNDGTAITPKCLYHITGDSTIYAHWIVNQYKVTYDYRSNGGTTTTKESELVAYNTAIPLSPTAAKPDWSFVGWNTDPTATTGFTASSKWTCSQCSKTHTLSSMPAHDITLYAIYNKTITATFIDGHNQSKRTITTTLYNLKDSCEITMPSITTIKDWNGLGWSFDTQGDADVHVSQNVNYLLRENVTFYACYTQNLTISYHTNGSAQTITPQTKARYFNASGNFKNPTFLIETPPALDKHSFVIWEELGADGIVIKNYLPQSSVTLDHSIVLTAKWDQHPEITAYDRYFTLEEAQNKKITANRLLEKVTATDRESETGFLVNGTDVIVLNFNSYDFIHNPNVTVTYQATDSFGNTCQDSIIVYIVDTTVSISPILHYSRFINQNFYKENDTFLSSEEGGLESTSLWRLDNAYRQLLEDALYATQPIKSFFFSSEDLKSSIPE